MTDEADIIEELAYMAERPELFAKDEMAGMLAAAVVIIRDLRMMVGIEAEIEPKSLKGKRPRVR